MCVVGIWARRIIFHLAAAERRLHTTLRPHNIEFKQIGRLTGNATDDCRNVISEAEGEICQYIMVARRSPLDGLQPSRLAEIPKQQIDNMGTSVDEADWIDRRERLDGA